MIFMMTFFVVESIFSIVILFVFEFIVIVIVIIVIIVIVISSIIIVIKIVIKIVLMTFIKELIAFRFDMIMFFAISAVFDEFLNDLVVEIRYNALLRFNNNDIF